MGWLFAVALGMQEGRPSAVWRALPPLAAGHGFAIGAAILVAMAAGIAVSPSMLHWPIGLLLIAMGIVQQIRHLHPRWASMRVGAAGLTWWSFLTASAHGAGLMVLPLFLSLSGDTAGPACHHAPVPTRAVAGIAAILVHDAGYLLATAATAWLFVDRLGLGFLRKAWVNVDLVWAAALIMTGVITVWVT
jgi:hypothetical protein